MTRTSVSEGPRTVTARPIALCAAPDAQTVVLRRPPALDTELRHAPRRWPSHTPAPSAAPAPAPSAAPIQAPSVAPAPAPRPPAPPAEALAMLRRIALQRDLANAVAVLQVELGRLLDARIAFAVMSDGRIGSPQPAELRDAAAVIQLAAIDACARRRQPAAAERAVLAPVDVSVPAVLVVWRTSDAPALSREAVQLAVAVASRLAVLEHFFVVEAEHQRQAAEDRASMFRPEALAAARGDRREGELVDLSPRWVRLAVPLVVVLAAALLGFAALVQVPSYSRGTAVVTMNGRTVISNTSGRISKVLVTPGQRVAAGDPLIELDATRERQALAQTETVYRAQLSTYLFDLSDEASRQSLTATLVQRKAAEDELAAKTIVAPVGGVISVVLANDLVTAGEHVATITPPDSEASVLAFMPGSDRSRIQKGMTLQLDPVGYEGAHLELVITDVGTEIIGAAAARKLLGQKLADGIAIPPLSVIVKARLPATSFASAGRTYGFSDGMEGVAEIAVDSKSFLSVVLPTGDRP